MQDRKVYLKCTKNVQVQKEDVFLSEVAEIRCRDAVLCAKLKAIKIHHFSKRKRCVISVLRIVELMEKECADIQVEIVGETDILIEQVTVSTRKGVAVYLKIIFIGLISFFGPAYSIMAYHNDIGINQLFTEVYSLLMGRTPDTINPLEVSYSIGLAAGIILFFNHIGGRKLTKDPTPIEVAMNQYEQDVDDTLIQLADREGREEENS